jgi:hypothetical protein
MSREREDQDRPCLHCMMVELIDDFFAEYPATAGSDKIDTAEADEVIDAIAKTVAELTSQQDGAIRQQVIEQLMHQIMHYDGEFTALTRSTDGGLGSTHPYAWTGRGDICGCEGPPQKYRVPQNGENRHRISRDLPFYCLKRSFEFHSTV